jgi:hypothetical protein
MLQKTLKEIENLERINDFFDYNKGENQWLILKSL